MPDDPSPPVATPPPAAELVIQSGALEGDAAELLKARRDLEGERSARKKEQTRLSELEDENRRLKTPPEAPRKAPAKKHWLDGATFFNDDDAA